MTMGRLRYIHLVLLFSLLIPLFMAYSVCVYLSETVLGSADMSFEDSDDEDLSTCQNDLKVFLPAVSLFLGTHLGRGSSFFWSPLTSYTQITPILRC